MNDCFLLWLPSNRIFLCKLTASAQMWQMPKNIILSSFTFIQHEVNIRSNVSSCFWTHTKSKNNTKVIARYFCWWMQMKISWSNNIWFWSIERMMISHKPFLFIIWFLEARNIILGISFPLFISWKMIQDFLCFSHFHKYQIPFKWSVIYHLHETELKFYWILPRGCKYYGINMSFGRMRCRDVPGLVILWVK